MLEKKEINSLCEFLMNLRCELFKHGANSRTRSGSLMLTARIRKAQSLE